MRLQRISIKKYKNLHDFDCIFSDVNISAFIGNNGSGKSNLLESISEVFSFAKNYSADKNPNFIICPDIYDCIIEYECDDRNYTLCYSKSEVSLFYGDKKLKKAEMQAALPKTILIYYAGETKRQERTAKTTFDQAYNNKLKRTNNYEFPGFKFMDYYTTDDLGLLLFAALVYKGEYIDNLLNLLQCKEIVSQVSIMLQDPKEKQENADTYWNARGFVKSFLDELRKYVSSTQDLSSRYVMEFKDIEPLSKISANEGEFFAKLKALRNTGYLEWVKIQFKGKSGEVFDFDTLSEGEKQLSLLLLLLSFTAQDECLYLFDEFDAYLHLNWQKAFSKMINEVAVNGHIVFTTHSPATVSGMHRKNVYIIADGKVGSAPSETYNRSLNEIMEEHMLVSMRPSEYNELVQEFRNAIMQNRKDIAIAKLDQMREIIGDDDPFYITARIALNRM